MDRELAFRRRGTPPNVKPDNAYRIIANGEPIGLLWQQGPSGRFRWAFEFRRDVAGKTLHTRRIDCRSQAEAQALAQALYAA